MLRFRNLAELKKNISPDVVIVDDDPPTEAKKQLAKQASNSKVLEDRFLFNWQQLGGPALEREVRFHPTRRWRFDFALSQAKVAFEIQGGLYKAQSGHRSKAGVERDYEKHNAASELGWTVWSLTSANIESAAYLAHLITLATKASPK